MKVKDFLEMLKDMPPDASMEFSKALTIDDTNEKMQGYELRLDFPVSGMALTPDKTELLFILSFDKTLAGIAKEIIPLE